MTLAQVKAFIIGVLKGWFTNKTTLDKFAEDESGNLTFGGTAVGGGTTYTDEEVSTAVTEALSELNTETTTKE